MPDEQRAALAAVVTRGECGLKRLGPDLSTVEQNLVTHRCRRLDVFVDTMRQTAPECVQEGGPEGPEGGWFVETTRKT
jgi:hypothetical protein